MSKITSVLFVGEFDIVPQLVEAAARHGAEVHLAFGPRQRPAWEALAGRSEVTAQALSSATVAESFDDVADALSLDESWLVLSIGAPFIFRRRHIDRVGGHIVNSHGAPLPEHAGGGGMSWRIMSGDRRGTVLLHRVSEGIDEGEVLRRVEFEFPAELRRPADYAEYIRPRIVETALELVDRILEDGELPEGWAQSGHSTYYPRLATDVHGAIDWSWGHVDVERFILAFGAPYPGAFTTWRGERVAVADAEVVDWVAGRPHPFMSGLIVAIDAGTFIVAANGGYLRLQVAAAGGVPRVGDRLVTPDDLLEKARRTRVEFLPAGLREQGDK